MRRSPIRQTVVTVAFVLVVVAAWQAFARQRVRQRVASAFQPLTDEVGTMGLPRRVRHEETGIALVLVDPGRFVMGTPDSEPQRDTGDEEQHEAEVESPFYLAETEVTVAQWKRFMGTKLEGARADEDLPMTGVSWHAAQEFLQRLNGATDGGWRLPTEVEWEYACRAGTTSPFSYGDNITPEQVNYRGTRAYAGGEPGLDRGHPVPVRSLPPNPWGLYEMHGNVWEWCSDLYVRYPGRGDRPNVGLGQPRVMRGGAFTSRAKQARSGYRDGYPPKSSGAKYGFRLAKSVAD